MRRLPEATPAHSALRLAVDTRAGGKPDTRPEWKRQRGRPCRTWVQQIEDDTGLNANDAWRIAHDRKSWRVLRPVAGQAFQWVSEWVSEHITVSDARCVSYNVIDVPRMPHTQGLLCVCTTKRRISAHFVGDSWIFRWIRFAYMFTSLCYPAVWSIYRSASGFLVRVEVGTPSLITDQIKHHQ